MIILIGVPLKSKFDVLSTFVQLYSYAKTQFGKLIKALQCKAQIHKLIVICMIWRYSCPILRPKMVKLNASLEQLIMFVVLFSSMHLFLKILGQSS